MKPRLVVLLLCASLIPAVQARATILPDACGDDGVKFSVKTEKSKATPAPPAEGKARIVFVENENQMIGLGMYATVRYGLDGNWAGANHSNSYFIVDVDPGVHHLCANWQSSLHMFNKGVDAVSITVESGKIYYFAANVTAESTRGYDTAGHGGGLQYSFDFSQLTDDEGKYRVKAWKLATWKSK